MDENSSQAQDRSKFKLTQTPQTFDFSKLKAAYLAIDNGDAFTDDASVWEHIGNQINLIEGEELNFKITTPDDLKLAESLSRFNPDV
jgi:2-C-methyl-D-erythritol 4-phosphate cytidylyltransferase